MSAGRGVLQQRPTSEGIGAECARGLNAIAAWLESQETPAPAARRYVAAMFAGLAEATRSGDRFEQLAREHATSGGINEQFLNGLERGGVFEYVSLGLQRVLDRLNTT
jgi:pyrroline-5-carboxylate reductase